MIFFLKFISTVPFFSSNLPQACNPVYNYWTSDSPKCKYYNRFMYSLRLGIKKIKGNKKEPPYAFKKNREPTLKTMSRVFHKTLTLHSKSVLYIELALFVSLY